jgi:hypothetical protein
MSRFILIGLVAPTSEETRQAFDDWYLGNHIEDTALCPKFISGTVYRLRGKHIGIDAPSEYMAIYEVEAESYEEAERVLNEWQSDPNAWEGRLPNNGSLKVDAAGWYEFERAYHTRG